MRDLPEDVQLEERAADSPADAPAAQHVRERDTRRAGHRDRTHPRRPVDGGRDGDGERGRVVEQHRRACETARNRFKIHPIIDHLNFKLFILLLVEKFIGIKGPPTNYVIHI